MLPAEWHPQDAVQLTFPHADSDWADMLEEVLPCFIELATVISRYQKVLIVCQDAIATANLLTEAVEDNLIFIELESNDTWARDHGGITVLRDRKAVVLDFIFNGWGLKFPADKDNLLTSQLAAYGIFKHPIKRGGMVLEGGGIESDGKGTLLVTSECLLSPNRNPHFSKKQTEAKLRRLLGVERFLWLHHGYLEGDDTDSHIDTLARFCDENTIAYVQCPDAMDDHFAALQKMEAELKTFKTVDGKPYKLVPLPWPDACYAEDGHRLPATYANFLIINGAVLVPTYRVAQDEAAIALFKKIFPKHDVIPVDCRVLIEQHGSLHCVTMQYAEGSLAI